MCSSKTSDHNSSTDQMDQIGRGVAKINGRPVLQPTCNRVPSLERRNSLKKASQKPLSPKKVSPTPPISPKIKSPKQQSVDLGLSCSIDKMFKGPKSPSSSPLTPQGPPGSIAIARREQVANVQELRKMKIAHYGRKKSLVKKEEMKEVVTDGGFEEKKCTFITTNSGI